MWREKAIRWGWFTAGLNLVVSLMNVFFSYNHLIKHEYWGLTFSLLLVLMNGGVAIWQYGNILKYEQELKEMMWETLSTPSEVLR
jgi:hypothetical protein